MDTESRTNPASLFLAREAVFMEMNIEAEIRERETVSEKASLILSSLLLNLHNSPLLLPRAAASSSHAPLITPMISLLISILPVPSRSRNKLPWRSGSCPRTNLRMHRNRQSRRG
ncbi:hypothetical protein F2Q69_00023943 [Brassica cretica]|uniref:Uncharacterized protein n=1 Tax=Brassica cretica TaxID=69181 RepID=A0A8S9QF20_BRACR|nr:hypothetical protein F2Q69_00023943 [Brassica cretica]